MARAILHAATSPQRDVFVGSRDKMFSVMEKVARDRTGMEQAATKQQKKAGPPAATTRDCTARATHGSAAGTRGTS